ncbi:MAG TPA: phosphoribosylglycinamide formyltransferase [bacterium]|nr:phosphoribosylglycinamide formyltransferase [bacterium]
MKIGIFISGSGTNMDAVVRSWHAGRFSQVDEVSFVLSDKADAAGLAKAAAHGVPTLTVARRKGEPREHHEARLLEAIVSYPVDLIVLAGFMRVLSPYFLSRFPGKIINIHPSLLPAFPGVDAQHQAFDHGVKISGCTVHFVDESLDGGPILLQKAVERLDGDTTEDLRQRILTEEHKLLSEAIEIVTTGRYRVSNRYVRVERNHES